MFSLCLPKKIQAIFKKDIHYLEGWVLVSRFSEKASLIQELLPEIGIRNSNISLYTMHVSVWNCISVHATDLTLGASSNRIYFSNITRSPEVAGPGKCGGSSTSPVPASLGSSPYASYLRSQDGGPPPVPHPSRKKRGEEEGDTSLHQKSKIFPPNPQRISTISLGKLGHLVAGYITSKVGGEEWLLGRLLAESTAVHP